MITRIKQFRHALSLSIRTSGVVPSDFKHFPAGACEVSSVMLMTYLTSCGYKGISYVSGTRLPKNGKQMQSHSFLKYKNVFIDITGSQFDDCNDEIIFEAKHELHRSFTVKDRGETDIFKYSDQGWTNYGPLYEATIDLIEFNGIRKT